MRKRYIKGFFALGLALTLSNSYLPNSLHDEHRRADERILRFEPNESNYRKLAVTSGLKIDKHIEHAIYLTNSGASDIQNHLQVAKEIVQALHKLMPHMQLIDDLNAMQDELEQGDFYQFNYDALAVIKKVNAIKQDMPEFTNKIKEGLRDIDNLIRNSEEQPIIVKQFSSFYAEVARQTAYIPIKYLENSLKKIEEILKQENTDQKNLFTLLKDARQSLAYTKSPLNTSIIS